MQNKIISKALSLTAAAVLGCTGILGSGSWITASANIEVGDYSGDAMQKVIVKVSGDAVLATTEGEALGADFLETKAAEAVEGQIESVQARVQRSIREFYPELTVKFSYSTLINGFYCELPESLVKYVREVPLVESVTVLPENAKLHMATAPGFSDYPAYYNATGCTGEGQVICVIDSELDMSHPMFAPLADDIKTKLSKDDIAEIIASGELNINCDADTAYRSNKLPFVFDYVDDDQVNGLLFEEMYHGTHVSGIAAGNEIEDDNGNIISGIAKDAQLIFLSVGSQTIGGIDLGAAIAATEDAVKLHADVINMSWGTEFEYFGVDPFAESITTAQNAGVMVCIAAGNADNGYNSYLRVPKPNNPDTGTMSDKAEIGSSALLVASADNVHTEDVPSFKVGDRLIRCYSLRDPFMDLELNPFDYLERTDLPYTYCGQGKEADLKGLDLTGQVAVVDRGIDDDCSFEDLAARAQAAGAIGIVYIDFELSDTSQVEFTAETVIPSGMVSYEDGRFMIEQENKIISNTEDDRIKHDCPTDVSVYTSWGVKQSLDLRPDIMGIGGYVESAGYNGAEETMSGTSMATPYICGCVAELCQYMEEKGIELTGKDKMTYIHNLLMNSAVPYTGVYNDVEMFVSPRRQGAGLVNLNNAINDKVIMTGDEGVAKVNLYDGLTDRFSFNLNLANISDEDVDFTSARLELTTDGTTYNELNEEIWMDGQQALDSSADLKNLLHVSAGENLSTTVSVSLNADQLAQISEQFTNGFFVEGYLVLEGAENCCNISIPLLGYYGDWAKLPIIADDTQETEVGIGTYAMRTGVSYSHALDIAKRMDEVSMSDATDEEKKAQLEELAESAVQETGYNLVSPKNGDGIADQIGIGGDFKRQCQYKIRILDAEGTVVVEKTDGLLQNKDIPYVAEPDDLLTDLPDGEYTMELIANIDYPTSYEAPQVYTTSFRVDNTAPDFKTEISEKDGRLILTMTSSDENYLDGIMVLGNGNAGIAGEYDPESCVGLTNMDYLMEAGSLLGGWGMFKDRRADAEDASPLARLILGTMTENEKNNYSFFDVISANKAAGEKFKVEYDITDLSDYCIAAYDGAFNMNIIQNDNYAVNFIDSGCWTCKKGIYRISGDAVLFTDIMTGDTLNYRYTLKDGVLTLKKGDYSETINVRKVDKTHMQFTYADGETLLLQNEYYADNKIYTVPELEEAVIAYMKKNLKDVNITKVETVVKSLEEVQVWLTINNLVMDVEAPFICNAYTGMAFSPLEYDEVNLFERDVEVIKPGTYMMTDGINIYFVMFNEDLASGHYYTTANHEDTVFTYAYDEETGKINFTFPNNEDAPVYSARVTVDDNDGLYIYEEAEYGTNIQALFFNGSGETVGFDSFFRTDDLTEMAKTYMETATGMTQEVTNVTCNGERFAFEFSAAPTVYVSIYEGCGEDEIGCYVDLTSPAPQLENNTYSIEMLNDWAMNDYAQKYDSRPVFAKGRAIDDKTVVIGLFDEYGSTIEIYTIDAATGIGQDSALQEVDLPQTGNNAPAGAATAAAAVVMMLIGMGTAAGTGVLRRKKDCE